MQADAASIIRVVTSTFKSSTDVGCSRVEEATTLEKFVKPSLVIFHRGTGSNERT
jgi:hypothetical protein